MKMDYYCEQFISFVMIYVNETFVLLIYLGI